MSERQTGPQASWRTVAVLLARLVADDAAPIGAVIPILSQTGPLPRGRVSCPRGFHSGADRSIFMVGDRGQNPDCL
jgi:hypothetical protein